MYKVELDFLSFDPPMDEHDPSIRLTRTIELPFPAYEGLVIHSRMIDVICDEPLGFVLKNVMWDMDRSVFLATTSMDSGDTPFDEIPDEIRSWIDRGWRLGSHLDVYPKDMDEPEEAESPGTSVEDDNPEAEVTPSQPARRRPARYNKIFRALIRTMAELHNNWSVAYAMYITQQFFTEEERKKPDAPPACRNSMIALASS
jgi:hypothetical protein